MSKKQELYVSASPLAYLDSQAKELAGAEANPPEASLANYINAENSGHRGPATALNLMNGIVIDLLENSPAAPFTNNIVVNPEYDQEENIYTIDIFPLHPAMACEDGETVILTEAEERHLAFVRARIGDFLDPLEAYTPGTSIRINKALGTICFKNKIEMFNLLEEYIHDLTHALSDIHHFDTSDWSYEPPVKRHKKLSRSEELKHIFTGKAMEALQKMDEDPFHEDNLLQCATHMAYPDSKIYLAKAQMRMEVTPPAVMMMSIAITVLEEQIRIEDGLQRDYALEYVEEEDGSGARVYLERRKVSVAPTLN